MALPRHAVVFRIQMQVIWHSPAEESGPLGRADIEAEPASLQAALAMLYSPSTSNHH